MNRMHKSQFRMMVAYFTLAVSVIGFYWIVTNLEVIGGWIGWIVNVMGPFIAGFIIAYILSIPVNSAQKLLERTNLPFLQHWKKAISVIAVYLLFIFIIYMALRLLLPPIIVAIVDLVQNIPIYYLQLVHFLENFGNDLDLPFDINLDGFFAEIFGEEADVFNPFNMITYEAIVSYIGTIIGGANAIFRGFLAFISSIYFLFETENLSKFLKRLLNAFTSIKTSSVILEYGNKTNQHFKKYIFCLIIDCIIMAVVGTIILTILGSQHALVLGLLLGVMNLIPYFGSIIATLVAVLVMWLTQGFAMGVVSAIVLLISQQLDANVLQPRLYGTSLKLSPLLVIISVSVGGAIGGVLGGAIGGTIMGMIVAIPCAKVLMNILDDIIDHREATRHIRNGQGYYVTMPASSPDDQTG